MNTETPSTSDERHALERAITALKYRADSLDKAISERPGAAIASMLADGVMNDLKAITTLSEILRGIETMANV